MKAKLLKLSQPLLTWWRALAPRERRAASIALWVLALFAAFSLFVQPAWRTLRAAPLQLDQLESELQRMQGLAAEAQMLRGAGIGRAGHRSAAIGHRAPGQQRQAEPARRTCHADAHQRAT